MKVFYYFIGCILFFSGCNSAIKSKHKVNYRNVMPVNQEERVGANIVGLKLDTIRIKGNQTSLEGHFFISGDTLCFADNVLVSVLFYNQKGQFLGSKLKGGRGPNEILGLHRAAPLLNGGCIIIDQQWGVYETDAGWNKIKGGRLKWSDGDEVREMEKYPDPNKGDIYEIEYGNNRIRPYGEEYILFPVVTEFANLNGFEGPHVSDYYREAYTIGLFSRDSLKLERLLCNYSPVYEQYHYLSNFKYPLFEVSGKDLIYSFEADTLIYVRDLQDTLVRSFGYAGKGMNTSYPEYRNFNSADENYREDRQCVGYYRYLMGIPAKDILFRGYRKGKSPMPDGLQIYIGYQYTGDFEVPRDFEVIGYIEPYFYAFGGMDYDSEEMIIYRFKWQEYD